jgi:hypothetical protein
MKRWLLASAGLGLLGAGISYVILLLATDTVRYLHVRSIALLIWPTGLFLMANEGATSSAEVATNFAWAIGGNILLYTAGGAFFYGLRTIARKISGRGET